MEAIATSSEIALQGPSMPAPFCPGGGLSFPDAFPYHISLVPAKKVAGGWISGTIQYRSLPLRAAIRGGRSLNDAAARMAKSAARFDRSSIKFDDLVRSRGMQHESE